ncbi:MAG: NAD(P)/FAD-dependent oxidoreductase [Candidatus Methanoperedens sp.]|nr:NAD(P)/FAD-dependent oxidoreductase [Candidatus Methanoperedens sp.]
MVRIAIAGSGISGAYLYRLLCNQGFDDVTVFEQEQPHKTNCGISPCAWGTSSGFGQLLGHTGLNPAKYALMQFNHIVMDEMRIEAYAQTFNKPLLISDLLQGTSVERSPINIAEYDRVIDATGVSRAYLPRIRDDIVLPCIQYRVHSAWPLELSIKISKVGYAWIFPLSGNEYHIGAGSLVIEPHKMLNNLGWIKPGDKREVLCGCTGKVRLTAPRGSIPYVFQNIWGVGEAIGCVAPLAGEGIIPGMRSAHILVENWNNPFAYEQAIQEEFAWMENERRVMDRLRRGANIGMGDGRVLQKTTKRLNMKLHLWEALKLLWRARK